MKKTEEELLLEYSNKEQQDKFSKLFSLSVFLRKAIFKKDYIISEKFSEYVVLTQAGVTLAEYLKIEKFNTVEDHIIKFSIFITFCHDALYIDIEKTNFDEIKRIIHNQILNNDILFPWRYGRLLYDKYFDEFEGEDESLEIDETLRLLNNTPKGVFQLKNIIVGPYGILETESIRLLFPTLDLYLWHCSDHSCNSFHDVNLRNEMTILDEIEDEINEIHYSIKESDWISFYQRLNEPQDYYDYNRTSEFHYLLIYEFSEKELKELLSDLLNSNPSIRQKFPDIKKLKGSTIDIIKNIDVAECFQLILLENDRNIIESLEKLIELGKIDIPATEIRKCDFQIRGNFFDITHECNKLGMRSITMHSNQSLVRLIRLIEEVHEEEVLRKDLEWKLMDFKKESLRETIEFYVFSEEPRTILRECILYGHRQTENAIKTFYGNFKMPNNDRDKEYLIDKMLWKLGFEINIFPTILDEFWQKLDSFKKLANTSSKNINKDEIRSVAVNFFVLLEEILEQTLSYITWTLLSDHFIDSKFQYDFESARNLMCEKLNGYIFGDNEPLKLDNTGNNNLFGLIEGFTALIEICDKLLLENKEDYQRPENEMPHFHNKTNLLTFPFPSKILIFDIKSSNYNDLKSVIQTLPKDFNKHKVASVRNRLEHKSRIKDRVDNFPLATEIIEACECIEQTVRQLINNGIYPNVFLLKSSTKDKFKREQYELEDYSGNIITLNPIPQFGGYVYPTYEEPQVISSIINVGNSCELLRFSYKETSDYLKLWKNYPRRKSKK